MRLVLDTNILIAALIKDSITRRILLLPGLEFLLPAFALDELARPAFLACLALHAPRSVVPADFFSILLGGGKLRRGSSLPSVERLTEECPEDSDQEA